MNKTRAMMFMIVFTFFNLCGCSQSPSGSTSALFSSDSASPSDLKKLITDEYALPNNYLIKINPIDISKIEIGPVRAITKTNYDIFGKKEERTDKVQSYEATIKLNCLNRTTNQILGTAEDHISGEISKNNMGKFQATGINSDACEKYQYGCVAGNCTNGLGMELSPAGILYIGPFKDGKLVGGIMRNRISCRCSISGMCVRPDFRNTSIMNDEHDFFTEEGLKELLNAQLISQDEYNDGMKAYEYVKNQGTRKAEEPPPAPSK